MTTEIERLVRKFNHYFGVDVRVSEWCYLCERADYWAEKLGVCDGYSDDHWEASIEDLDALREEMGET